MSTNGQPTAVSRPQPVRPPLPPTNRVQLHPEAENLAYGYSDLLMELDHARAKISKLQRELEEERRERLYWKNFVRQVAEAGMRMLQEESQD